MTTALQVHPVAPDVYVAPQLDARAMAEVARVGFRAVINNRPDFEGGPDQPTNASVEAAARAAGLEFRFLPVSPMVLTEQDIEAFTKLLAELPRPLLIYCRTGTRSMRLFRAASAC